MTATINFNNPNIKLFYLIIKESCVVHARAETKHKVGHKLHYVTFNNIGAEVKVYYFLMRE